VEDLGDITQLRQRGRPTLRLDERVWPFLSEHLDAVRTSALDETFDVRGAVHALLEEVRIEESWGGHERFRRILVHIGRAPRVIEFEKVGWEKEAEDDPGSRSVWAVLGPFQRAEASDREGPDLISDEADGESFTEGSVPLGEHGSAVSALADFFAGRLGLSQRFKTTLRWAGLVHDVGKGDPRFLAMLHGGDLITAKFAEPVAKSPLPPQDARARARARKLAGYPLGQRHEMVSLEMIESSSELRAAVEADKGDWELLLHLVASHHGWGRPFAPVMIEKGPRDAVEWTVEGIRLQGTTDHRRERTASGVARRFLSLGRRLGWHELAYLEAILRLADHRVSEWNLPA